MVEPIFWDLRAVSTECVDGVCFRDYRTIIIKSWSIPKRDFQQLKSCNPSISLFVKDSKDRYRAVSKKLSNETKLFPGGR